MLTSAELVRERPAPLAISGVRGPENAGRDCSDQEGNEYECELCGSLVKPGIKLLSMGVFFCFQLRLFISTANAGNCLNLCVILIAWPFGSCHSSG